MISEKNKKEIVFQALSNGAISILLRCSGAEIYRFFMLHSKRIILYTALFHTQVDNRKGLRMVRCVVRTYFQWSKQLTNSNTTTTAEQKPGLLSRAESFDGR